MTSYNLQQQLRMVKVKRTRRNLRRRKSPFLNWWDEKEHELQKLIWVQFHHTTLLERIWILVAAAVACFTGAGYPLMSILQGRVTGAFAKYQSVVTNGNSFVYLETSSLEAMRNGVRDGRENDSFLTLFRVAWGFQIAIRFLLFGQFSIFVQKYNHIDKAFDSDDIFERAFHCSKPT